VLGVLRKGGVIVRRNAYTATMCFLLVGLLATLCVAASPIGADRRPEGVGAGTVVTKGVHAPRIPLHRAPTGTGPGAFVPGRLLVKFRSDVLDGQRKVHLAVEGLMIAEHLTLLDVETVSVPVGQELDLAKELVQLGLGLDSPTIGSGLVAD